MKATTIIGALALLVWGVIMVYFYQSGRVGEYLASKGIFQPLLLVGGLGLTLVSIFNILHSGKNQGCGHDHGDDHDHDHGDDEDHVHAHETTGSVLVSVLILSIPVSAAAILTPDQYSTSYVNKNIGLTDGRQKRSGLVERIGSGNKGGEKQTAASTGAGGTPPEPGTTAATGEPDEWEFTIEDLENSLDRNEAGEFIIGVDDLFYTAGDEEIQRVLNGQPVETIGQLLPETVNNESGRRVRILKMTMTCCAADMRPMSLPVEFAETPPDFVELNWYKVHGKVRFEPAPAGYGQDDYDVPFVEGLRIEPTEEPENPYGY